MDAVMISRRYLHNALLFFACVLAIGMVIGSATTAFGATASERPQLTIDRSSISTSSSQWDELSGLLRQHTTQTPAAIFNTAPDGIELDNNYAAGSDECGSAAASGDLDGDGLDDVVVGCHLNNDGAADAGSFIAYIRTATNTGFDTGVEVDNNFPAASDECGTSLAVGDVNGDGLDDVVVGCSSNDDGAGNAGSVIVYISNGGSPITFAAGVELDNNFPAAGDQCGISVASGDIDGDGRADVVMGCLNNDDGATDAGSAIVFISTGGTPATFAPGVEIDNNFAANGDKCGQSVTTGDANGDGLSDVALGCPGNDDGAADAGSVIVFASTGGSPITFDAGVERDNNFPAASDDCGNAVSMGDTNGDGLEDLEMGCVASDDPLFDSGGAIVFVSTGGLPLTYAAGVELDNPNPVATDGCGSSVSLADVTGDGRADVTMGCVFNDDGAGNAGSVVVYARNQANTGYDVGIELRNPFPAIGDQCGESMATGDIDGDGRMNIVLGCIGNDDGAADAGSAVVMAWGSSVELDNPFAAATDNCAYSVQTGDVNGDGLADVVMGCPGNNDGAADAGSVIIYPRNASNSGYDAGIELDNQFPAALDECGIDVAVGDVDADGLDDVVVGCQGNDDGAADAGSVIIYTSNGGSPVTFDAGVELDNQFPAIGDKCGRMVAASDVDGDGRDDVAIGCLYNDDGAVDTGSVIVYTSNGGAPVTFDPGIELDNSFPAASDECGSSVAFGDVDVDGLADIVVGCHGNDDGAANAGSMIVYTSNGGSPVTFAAGVELDNNFAAANDNCGDSVATGDVDADGRSDVMMGCSTNDDGASDAGSMIIYASNGGSPVTFDAGVELDNQFSAATDHCGIRVAFGDVNADGLADPIMGCNLNDDGAVDTGSVIAYTSAGGSPVTFASGVEVDNPYPSANDWCGRSLATGDVNGDGRSDFSMGCYQNDDGAVDAGSVVTIMSTVATRYDSMVIDPAGSELDNPFPAGADACGTSVAVGDVNADGRQDVALGCSGNDDGAADAGSVVVFVRAASGVGYLAGVELDNTSPAANEQCGASVAIGDFSGDGRDDVAIGCPGTSSGASGAGSAQVFTRNALNTGFDAGVEVGNAFPAANDTCGGSVAAGDVNSNGREDLLLGCAGNDDGAVDAGSVIIHTSNGGSPITFAAGVELDNNFAAGNDVCGTSVAAGDVNADSRDDVIMGCPGNSDGGVAAGSAIVFTRNALNTNFDAGIELDNAAPAASDLCGQSVALGDVNDDGRKDVVTGCPGNDDGAADAGSVQVFVRNLANTSFVAAVELKASSTAAADACGSAVGSGDLDGDSHFDVGMGCPGNDDGASNAGSIVVFARNAANTSFDTGTELDDVAAVAGDDCGASGIAFGDATNDGRDEVVASCEGNDDGAMDAGSSIVFQPTAYVTTRRLNALSVTITDATVTLQSRANGVRQPTLELSADGGATWEPATSGSPHSFGSTGSDLRARIDLPADTAGGLHRTQVVHDISVDYTYIASLPPSTPALASPANGSSTSDTTPDLSATFSDPDVGDTGTLSFEVCTLSMPAGQSCVAAGGTLLASGSTASGITNGANGTWTVAPALVPQVVYWHARATDSASLSSSWSASRSLTIQETITLGVDSGTLSLGAILLGQNVTGTTIIDVHSNDPQGYSLTATDESDTWGADCLCGGTIPDWTGSGATPTTWSALTDGYMGATVRDVSGWTSNRLAKWGTVNAAGWPEADFTNNLYAGLNLGTSALLHTTSGAAPADTITATWRVNPSSSTTAGAYDATITITAFGNP